MRDYSKNDWLLTLIGDKLKVAYDNGYEDAKQEYYKKGLEMGQFKANVDAIKAEVDKIKVGDIVKYDDIYGVVLDIDFDGELWVLSYTGCATTEKPSDVKRTGKSLKGKIDDLLGTIAVMAAYQIKE